MTTKEILKWRLSKLPTSEEVLKLLNEKLITREEARQILFSTEAQEERDADSLKAEIKFLREIVDKLSDRKEIVKTIEVIEKHYHDYPWIRPYAVWCSSSSRGYSDSIATNTAHSGTLVLNATAGLSEVKTF